ncbi:DUF5615 family PIN-like protein [Candidatus Sumerlaeota bacterium]|nr:DUF5615 family PIN-like protein [Candidatus Sumerlaeota bacterium]
MTIRFFADHCIPRSIIQFLRNAGYEALILKEHIPSDSDDHRVIDKAQELNAILISLNSDFTNIISFPPSNYKGIISLQIKNHPEIIPITMETLQQYLSDNADMEHYKGLLLLVEPHRIRKRK